MSNFNNQGWQLPASNTANTPAANNASYLETILQPEDFFEGDASDFGATGEIPAKEYIKMYLRMVFEKIINANPPHTAPGRFAFPQVKVRRGADVPNLHIEISYYAQDIAPEKMPYGLFEQAVKFDYEASQAETKKRKKEQ